MAIDVSIIIPTYNVVKYIAECLDSLMSQSLRNIEVLCIDDGSKDGTVDIIECYEKNDSRINFVQQSHKGVSYARNKALDMAKGKYVMFVDGDDMLYDATVLEVLYLEAEKHDVEICGGNVILFEKDWGTGRRYPSTRNPAFVKDGEVFFVDYGCPYGFTQYIYKKELIIKNNIFFPNYACWEDPVFMAEVFSKAKRFWALNRYVYCYRRGIHKKEHRMSDIKDLLFASADLMRIGADNNNFMLQRDTLSVLYSHRNKILQMYEYDSRLVCNRFEEIRKWVRSEVVCDSREQMAVIEEEYYIERKQQKELSILRLIDDCKDKSIIIYGAGTYGKRMYEFLKSYSVPVIGFAVTDMKGNACNYIYGKPIKKAEEWIEYTTVHFGSFIISVYDKKQRDLIKKYLIEKAVNFIEFDLDFLDEKLIL